MVLVGLGNVGTVVLAGIADEELDFSGNINAGTGISRKVALQADFPILGFCKRQGGFGLNHKWLIYFS
jgi:hypothetical protein